MLSLEQKISRQPLGKFLMALASTDREEAYYLWVNPLDPINDFCCALGADEHVLQLPESGKTLVNIGSLFSLSFAKADNPAKEVDFFIQAVLPGILNINGGKHENSSRIRLVTNLILELESAIIAAFVAVPVGFPVMWLWNWLMPTIFDLPSINFFQAIGLCLLSSLLIRTGNSGSDLSKSKIEK